MTGDSLTQDTVYALAASPEFAGDGVCFAARASGLYRSEDGGATWQDAYVDLGLTAPLTTAAVALSPDFAHDRTVFAGALGGVLRTVDGGHSWTVATLPSPPPFVAALAVSPAYAEDGLVFAGTTEDGVLRSWDRGASWAAWNFGLLDLNVYALAISPDFGRDETLFVGTESGVFRSTNGGRAWRETPFPMDCAPVFSLALSPAFGTDGVIWAGTEAHGILRSADRGATWAPVEADLPTGAVNALLLDPTPADDTALLALVGSGIYRLAGAARRRQTLYTADADMAGPTALAAPLGRAGGAALLVGLDDGRVRVQALPAATTGKET
jgi:photosystem II stability/assembly factor-like uncharacterized protein